MAIRIVGVDLPQNKRGEIALTYIFGIGRSSSAKILEKAGVDKDMKVKDWNDEQAGKIREIISAEYKVEGDLRSEIQLNIKRLMDIGCYRGIRHRFVDRVQRIMHVHVKVRRRQLQTRKKLLNNIEIWQRKQLLQRREMSRLTLRVSFMFIPHSITSLLLWQIARVR